jgi:hypothetical protein
LPEHRDATSVRQLLAQFVDLLLSQMLVRHVADHSAHEIWLAVVTQVHRPAHDDPAQTARGGYDAELQDMLAAALQSLRERCSHLCHVVGVSIPQHVLHVDVGMRSESHRGARALRCPDSPGRGLPCPESRTRSARSHIETSLALAQISCQPRSVQHVPTELERHRRKCDHERRHEQDRQLHHAPDHHLREHGGEHDRSEHRREDRGRNTPIANTIAPHERITDVEHEQRKQHDSDHGEPLILTGDRARYDGHVFAEERDLLDRVDALEIDVGVADQVEQENQGARCDERNQQPGAAGT